MKTEKRKENRVIERERRMEGGKGRGLYGRENYIYKEEGGEGFEGAIIAEADERHKQRGLAGERDF